MSKSADKAAAELVAAIDEHRRKPVAQALGIHFDLPMEDYLRDPGLSSSEMKVCARSPAEYWWQSWMNPLRPEDGDTEARMVGRAMHTRVLEGIAEFDRYYERGPDQHGMTSAQKAATTRAANAAAAEKGKECLKADAYGRIVVASAMISKNPHLARAFTGGRSEVSLFFKDGDGVRRKIRMDYLKTVRRKKGDKTFTVLGIGDLKSVANERGLEFEEACYRAIADWRYDVQGSYYIDAMPWLRETAREEAFRCHLPNQPAAYHEAMDAFVAQLAQATQIAFQWVFHQSSGPPLTHSMVLSAKNPILETGRATYKRGLERWKEAMAKWGENDAWVPDTDVREAEMERMPSWYAR